MSKISRIWFIILCVTFLLLIYFYNFSKDKAKLILVSDDGWSQTAVNATIFRKNSIVSNSRYQFIAYYNSEGRVVIGKRRIGRDKWDLHETKYSGNVKDAHNVICLGLDGNDILHMSWDHHNNPLNYCMSVEPNSLVMSDSIQMIGCDEDKVSYPEFYRFSNGDLLFVYRDGKSGDGNLILNKYSFKNKKWYRMQNNLISGEGQRNAYWQICIDDFDTIHLSWVWRENPDVLSNHDLCYAKSDDRGLSWTNSSDVIYELPITLNNAEVALHIPQQSNLINQTSICADHKGLPFIATYFRRDDRSSSHTQLHLIYQDHSEWNVSQISRRKSDFSLKGRGSRSLPISRPQVMIGKRSGIYIIYRDQESGNCPCIASSTVRDIDSWEIMPLLPVDLNFWEPSFDLFQWKYKNRLNIYIQAVGQNHSNDGSSVFILECNPSLF